MFIAFFNKYPYIMSGYWLHIQYPNIVKVKIYANIYYFLQKIIFIKNSHTFCMLDNMSISVLVIYYVGY